MPKKKTLHLDINVHYLICDEMLPVQTKNLHFWESMNREVSFKAHFIYFVLFVCLFLFCRRNGDARRVRIF